MIFSQFCSLGSLDTEKVEGKIVVCLRGVVPRVEKGRAVLEAGGVGMILVNDRLTGNETSADAHILPATHVSSAAAASIYQYIDSTK